MQILSKDLLFFSYQKKINSSHFNIQLALDGLPLYLYTVEELFGKNIHKRVYLGHNNAIESKYSLFKDFVRAKRRFKKFSNIFLYINSFILTHNLYKDCVGDKDAVLSALFPFVIYG